MMKRSFKLLSLLAVFALLLAACAPAAAPTAAPTTAPEPTMAPEAPATTAPEPTKAPEPTATTAAAPEATATTAPAVSGMDYSKVGPELADAFAGKYKGTTVTMSGPFTDADAVKFENSQKDFEEKTGIKIEYTGSKEFEASIAISINGGNPPDIVDFPQPGLLNNFAKTGKPLDLSKIINAAWLKENYKQSWLDMGTMTTPSGPILAGIWNRTNVKGLVWYPKAEFDKAGYKVPTTQEELVALTDQIRGDGDTPWCIGIESGAATGWVATDWTENFMLRTTSLENYDKWVAGTLKFSSPEVKKAIQTWSDMWFKDGNVYGGRKSIATTSFQDASKPMFEVPNKCWLHIQGSFVVSFFPTAAKMGTDYDFFYQPPVDPAYGKPVEVGGDIYAAFNDRPEVRAAIQWFTLGESVKGWVQAGGAISPHNDADLAWYTNDLDRKVAQVLKDADSFRFDASDLMPGAVGSGSFWKQMTSYVSGAIDLDTALKAIDDSWPATK
jgi:alpha-glucoside transport system substrate-binding protein